jgi:hypothetical protein
VLRTNIEKPETLADREVALHLAVAVRATIQLLPTGWSVGLTHQPVYSSAMNG